MAWEGAPGTRGGRAHVILIWLVNKFVLKATQLKLVPCVLHYVNVSPQEEPRVARPGGPTRAQRGAVRRLVDGKQKPADSWAHLQFPPPSRVCGRLQLAAGSWPLQRGLGQAEEGPGRRWPRDTLPSPGVLCRDWLQAGTSSPNLQKGAESPSSARCA